MIGALGRVSRQCAKWAYKVFLDRVISHYHGDIMLFVMYHNIDRAWRNNSITPADFEDGLLGMLQAGFKNYSLEELMRADFAFRGRGFVITFDDGEKGVVQCGLPILKKYGLTASVFISPALMGESWGFSWRKLPKSVITLGEIERYQGYRIDYMNVDDVKRWLDAGCEVGSHGLRHLDLAAVSIDPLLLKQEVGESKEILEQLLGIRVDSFCYPFGAFNEVVKDYVKAHYRCALTVVKGGISGSRIDRYELPRITGGNSFKFLLDASEVIRSFQK